MDILEKIDQYTGQSIDESFASYMKRYFPNVNVDTELMYVPGLTLTRFFLNNELYHYLESRLKSVIDHGQNNDGIDYMIKQEFKKVSNQYDIKVLNTAIYKVEELRQPKKMNKKEAAEFKKFKSWMGKLAKGWVKQYEAIAASYKINTSKLKSWEAEPVTHKKTQPAFEEWVQKAFGVKVKTKVGMWRAR